MKKLKIFWILALSQILILLINLFLQFFNIHNSLTDFYIKEQENTLLKEAYLIENKISNYLALNKLSELQKPLEDFGQKLNSRITIILLDGKVVADTMSSLDRLDNHKDRPEIKVALEGKIGKIIRYSDTLNEETVYVAIPIRHDDRQLGVLRLSESTNKLKNSLQEVFSNFFIVSLVITLIFILIIGFYSRSLSLSLEKMSTFTEKFLKGEFTEKIKINSWDSQEISSLGKSLNKMSEQIEVQISKIIKQKKEQQAVLSSMSEGVLTIDNNKKIYHINDSAKKIFNLDLEKNYKGVALKEVIRAKKVEDFYEKIISSKVFLEKELELNDNQFFQVHGSLLSGENNNALGALLVFNDISDIRRLEQHRKDFVANVSHELKTPLTSINGYLENLIDGSVDTPEDRLKFLKIVQKHSLRLQKIIEDLLILSQVEGESGENLNGEILEISPILSSVKSIFNEKSDKIVIECEKNLKAKVNSHLLEIAIGNLLQNALRYGPKDVPIILAAKSVNGLIEISVKDQGSGIPAEHHHRLFERFYSVDKSRSRDFGGSGLGLSIVKHVAMAHKGSVGVKSEPGKGSIFSIFIPRC